MSEVLLKMRFFRDDGVTDFCSCKIGIQYILYIRFVLVRQPGRDPKQLRWGQLSSCIVHTLRFCARIFLVLPKKSLFLEAPLFVLRSIVLLSLIFPFAVVQAEEIRDPMRPPAFALKKFQQAKNKNKGKSINTGVKLGKPAAKPLRLTSILYSAGRKIAIIDDRMLRVGDTIRNAKVVRINRNSARLLQKGKFIELKLNNVSSAIKKTPSERNL